MDTAFTYKLGALINKYDLKEIANCIRGIKIPKETDIISNTSPEELNLPNNIRGMLPSTSPTLARRAGTPTTKLDPRILLRVDLSQVFINSMKYTSSFMMREPIPITLAPNGLISYIGKMTPNLFLKVFVSYIDVNAKKNVSFVPNMRYGVANSANTKYKHRKGDSLDFMENRLVIKRGAGQKEVSATINLKPDADISDNINMIEAQGVLAHGWFLPSELSEIFPARKLNPVSTLRFTITSKYFSIKGMVDNMKVEFTKYKDPPDDEAGKYELLSLPDKTIECEKSMSGLPSFGKSIVMGVNGQITFTLFNILRNSYYLKLTTPFSSTSYGCCYIPLRPIAKRAAPTTLYTMAEDKKAFNSEKGGLFSSIVEEEKKIPLMLTDPINADEEEPSSDSTQSNDMEKTPPINNASTDMEDGLTPVIDIDDVSSICDSTPIDSYKVGSSPMEDGLTLDLGQ